MRSVLVFLAVQSVASLVLSPVQQLAPAACARTTAVSSTRQSSPGSLSVALTPARRDAFPFCSAWTAWTAWAWPCARACGPLLTSLASTRLFAVAHHVELKATRKHNKNRPKKSRPSDIYRTPPSYPTLPDIPWMSKLETVEVMVAPSDTADTLKTKVVAAGAKAPTVFMYQGKAVSGTLADCGLATATTIKVKKA